MSDRLWVDYEEEHIEVVCGVCSGLGHYNGERCETCRGVGKRFIKHIPTHEEVRGEENE